ncbi:MAG: hypothetical protein ACP5VR_10475 [Acidimicrobiales bacterium]
MDETGSVVPVVLVGPGTVVVDVEVLVVVVRDGSVTTLTLAAALAGVLAKLTPNNADNATTSASAPQRLGLSISGPPLSQAPPGKER